MSLFEDTAWDPSHRAKMSAIVLIVIGFSIALWGGCADLKETVYSASEPQTMTAAQLATDGPGGNLHVLVTDYHTSADGRGNEDVAWFIVHSKPAVGEGASILLKTEGGNAFFGVFVPEDGLQGMVRSGNDSLNADLRNAIKKLGRVDFDNVWIIDHNRPPPAWWSFLLKILGGLALVGVGAVIFVSSSKD